MARVRVRLFHEVRDVVGSSELELEANTLQGVIDALTASHPELKRLIMDKDGRLRGYAQIYLNNKPFGHENLGHRLSDGDLILLIPPVGGG